MFGWFIAEVGVGRAIDLAHAACADGGKYLVWAETGAGGGGQWCAVILGLRRPARVWVLTVAIGSDPAHGAHAVERGV